MEFNKTQEVTFEEGMTATVNIDARWFTAEGRKEMAGGGVFV